MGSIPTGGTRQNLYVRKAMVIVLCLLSITTLYLPRFDEYGLKWLIRNMFSSLMLFIASVLVVLGGDIDAIAGVIGAVAGIALGFVSQMAYNIHNE